MNNVRPTADGAVFDILLAVACRQIEWNDNFLTAGVAEVTRLVAGTAFTFVALHAAFPYRQWFISAPNFIKIGARIHSQP